MLKKFASLIEYIGWLYKHNLELQKSTGNIFRIIKTEKDKNEQNIIDIQVINKSTVFRSSAKEIAGQDQLLECFSKNDVRIITYLATEEIFKAKNKIVGLEYNDETKQTIIKIKTKGSDDIKSLTADKISKKDLISSLSQQDAHKAGYLLAVEQMLLEKQTIEKCK